MGGLFRNVHQRIAAWLRGLNQRGLLEANLGDFCGRIKAHSLNTREYSDSIGLVMPYDENDRFHTKRSRGC